MFPFRSKIDPFSAYTINLGPLYVERVFDSLLIRLGTKSATQLNAAERYALYLDYLKNNIDVHNHTQYAITQFYKGYFYQQLACHSIGHDTARHFQEKALCYYQNYLELAHREDESRYYAQWQIGLLQDLLDYPWPLVEDSLHKATAIDPLRGEALMKVVDHYIAAKEWRSAHHHSRTAVEKYYDKNPIARRRWFVDFDAYNSTVLSRHQKITLQVTLHNSSTHGKAATETIAEHRQL
jgi:tetratricopeptide (TPR) repeat protein